MSHTIKPVKKDNQQSSASSSPANQNSTQPQDSTPESGSLLSDADYEFLFNQLLEGIAHGWYDRRIIKFFQQLGERGNQEDWVAWLERLKSKVVNLPLQSKRQLGTMMIRLGELTQSAKEVKEIGAVSLRLGRELLFANTEDLIWEYAGPDLVLDNTITPSTRDNILQRLPEDFLDLGTATNNTVENTETDLPYAPTAKSQVPPEQILDNGGVEEPKEEMTKGFDAVRETQSISEAISPKETTELNPDLSSKLPLEATPLASIEENLPETLPSLEPSELKESPNLNTVADLNSEFELETSESPAIAQNQNNTTEPAIADPVAIDMAQVMNLLQEDEQLAQEVAQKLNHSITNLEQSSEELTPSKTVDSVGSNIDQSSIELIEGWFNLGLKQVSAGEFDQAIASWEKALKINPNLSEAWHNRGSALGRLGKYPEAVASFQKALSIDPNNYQAWNDRAHALYQLQDWVAAADSWSNAIKLNPGNHLFWYNRGCALEQLENWAESIASYEKSLEIKPDFQPARTRYTNLIADNSRSN